MRLVNNTAVTRPTKEQLSNSIWVNYYDEFFLPTHMTTGWVLVAMGDCDNGYYGSGYGWGSVDEMWEKLGDQFEKLVPFETLILQSNDIIYVTQN